MPGGAVLPDGADLLGDAVLLPGGAVLPDGADLLGGAVLLPGGAALPPGGRPRDVRRGRGRRRNL